MNWKRIWAGNYHARGWYIKRERVISAKGRKVWRWALYVNDDGGWRLVAHYATLRDAKTTAGATAVWMETMGV